MARSYAKIRLHKDWVYSTEEVLEKYDICANTLTNWIKQGLRRIETARPHLYRGAELIRFHQDRRARGRTQLRHGEFKCVGCKQVVLPEPAKVDVTPSTSSVSWTAITKCPDCSTLAWKILNATECDSLRALQANNTSWDYSDERAATEPAHIGISLPETIRWNPVNEKLVRDWILFAGKYDDKTKLAHLADIRRFEAFIGYKSLSETTTLDAGGYREKLTQGQRGAEDHAPLSASTIRHTASCLAGFFTWLVKHVRQPNLEAVPSYFALRKALHQDLPQSEDRKYVSIETAEKALGLLPQETLLDRRNRAIFAFSYLAALRENALITLRLRHVDVDRKVIWHDGKELRAKNGKSFEIRWFNRTDAFAKVAMAWVAELQNLGARSEDALFPSSTQLSAIPPAAVLSLRTRSAWEPMATASAVDAVFKRASAMIGTKITPHSARHTIAALGDQICRTQAQRKAWSLNMGHNSTATTFGHYGRMTNTAKNEVLEAFDVMDELTREEMLLLINLEMHNISRGSLDYDRAVQVKNRLEMALNSKRRL